MKYPNGIVDFLHCTYHLQGDAGTPGKSIEMKVRKTYAILF